MKIHIHVHTHAHGRATRVGVLIYAAREGEVEWGKFTGNSLPISVCSFSNHGEVTRESTCLLFKLFFSNRIYFADIMFRLESEVLMHGEVPQPNIILHMIND